MKKLFLLFILLHAKGVFGSEGVIKLKIGFVRKILCEGRLYTSAIGNEGLVRSEALPKELGCAIILKPMGALGKTNLIIETSVGTVERDIIVLTQ